MSLIYTWDGGKEEVGGEEERQREGKRWTTRKRIQRGKINKVLAVDREK